MRQMLLLTLLGALGPALVSCHANIVWPYTWFDKGGNFGMSPGTQCYSGYEYGAGACSWFSNYTFISGEPTLPDYMRTFQDANFGGFPYDWTKTNPWRHPGSAPVWSPCGVAGGNPNGCPEGEGAPGDDCPGGGFAYGPAAENVAFEDVQTTEWQRGGVAEVGWGIIANHGGGYSYRLCPAPQNGEEVVTEECFQQMPLKFHGDEQWVQYGYYGPKVTFPANRTTEGTWPEGSQWTKNPIPACHNFDGGWMEEEPHCVKDGPQFPPPAPGLLGYGESYLAPGQPQFMFTIMDEVEVPDVTPGAYVLSFRWDCEQTSQIWNGCANIRIV